MVPKGLILADLLTHMWSDLFVSMTLACLVFSEMPQNLFDGLISNLVQTLMFHTG